MNIVVTDASTVLSEGITLDFLNKFGGVAIYDLTDADSIFQRIAGADILLCNKTPITDEVIKSAPNLKYIGLFATGYNNIDLESAKRHGVTVCNVAGYSTEAVAQHTFALILSAYNRVGEYNQTVKQGDWKRSRTFSYFPIPLCELSGKTLGIVGYGEIGRRVADIAKAFKMKVLVVNRSKIIDSSVEQVCFDEMLEKSDIVSLHCPLNDDSRNLMNKSAFDKMKTGAVFINTARGPIVDETALRDALLSGKLLAAGVDVLCVEPMDENCVLYGIDNCYITPHIAWAGVETRQRLMKIVEKNIEQFLKGEPINKIV